jgi:hypothetical protein
MCDDYRELAHDRFDYKLNYLKLDPDEIVFEIGFGDDGKFWKPEERIFFQRQKTFLEGKIVAKLSFFVTDVRL